MRGDVGWANRDGMLTSRPNRVARAAVKPEVRRPKAEGNPNRESRTRGRQGCFRRWSFVEVVIVGSDWAVIGGSADYMISLRRPPVGALSAAEGVRRAVRPWGWGSVAAGSMPSSSYMLPMRSQG